MTLAEPPNPAVDTNRELSVPGKIFLLGEYAVLEGMPAWVVAVPPRFRWRAPGAAKTAAAFHPDSPAARFARAFAPAVLGSGEFVDAWSGQGGFGGSTAEFAIAAYLSGVRDPLEAHRRYRELHRDTRSLDTHERVLPSGADLVAQWVGGAIEWTPASPDGGTIRSIGDEFREASLLLFSATHLPDRKTKTHAHLESLAEKPVDGPRFASLAPVIELARSALDDGDFVTLGNAFTRYAEALHELGLESESAHADRIALSELPGVVGVKGCGALQSDALIVLLDAPLDSEIAASAIAFAEETLNLRLLSRGLPNESGIREEG